MRVLLVVLPAGWSDPPSRLTDTERRLLRLLVAGREGVEREIIHREVFGYGPAVVSRSIDAAVARLRRKLGAACVVTAYGRGYRFVPSVSYPTAAPPPPCPTRRHGLGECVVDLDRRTARLAGVERPLTEQNVRLIELLEAARPGRVDRQTLARTLGIGQRAVTDAVHRLRHKIEADPADPQIVVASAGGYRLARATPRQCAISWTGACSSRPAPDGCDRRSRSVLHSPRR